MKVRISILILAVLFLNLQMASAEENKYGIVRAWFNGKNATVETIEGIKLKIGEPVEVKVEVISKISGHVFVEITEPGVTKAFDVLSGPSKQDERIDNLNIESGWSKTYTWTIAPSGAWTNGNAPINMFVSFFNSNKRDQKPIQFTIANPYILDEQYSGAVSTPKPPPATTEATPGTASPPKSMPFPSALFAFTMLLAVWRWRLISRVTRSTDNQEQNKGN